MFQLLGILSGAVNILGFPSYVRDIFHGKTRPERASWLIWMVLSLIAFFTQLAEGATNSLWLPGASSFTVGSVFLLSLWRGTGGLTRRDSVVLSFAALSLLLWYLTNDAFVALVIVVLLDGAGAVLTFLKTLEDPHSETLFAWMCSFMAGVLAFLSVGQPSFSLLLYPAYAVIANGAITWAIVRGRRRPVQVD